MRRLSHARRCCCCRAKRTALTLAPPDRASDYHFDSAVNYGALPQTWEDPSHRDASTGFAGDNDPVDVVEVGGAVLPRGQVLQARCTRRRRRQRSCRELTRRLTARSACWARWP